MPTWLSSWICAIHTYIHTCPSAHAPSCTRGCADDPFSPITPSFHTLSSLKGKKCPSLKGKKCVLWPSWISYGAGLPHSTSLATYIHPPALQMKPLETLTLLLELRLEGTIGVAVNASTDLQATQMRHRPHHRR